MTTLNDARWCNHCQRTTQHERQGLNHLLHLILSLATGGAWLLVWLILGMTSGNQQAYCCNCKTPYATPNRTIQYAKSKVDEGR